MIRLPVPAHSCPFLPNLLQKLLITRRISSHDWTKLGCRMLLTAYETPYWHPDITSLGLRHIEVQTILKSAKIPRRAEEKIMCFATHILELDRSTPNSLVVCSSLVSLGQRPIPLCAHKRWITKRTRATKNTTLSNHAISTIEHTQTRQKCVALAMCHVLVSLRLPTPCTISEYIPRNSPRVAGKVPRSKCPRELARCHHIASRSLPNLSDAIQNFINLIAAVQPSQPLSPMLNTTLTQSRPEDRCP